MIHYDSLTFFQKLTAGQCSLQHVTRKQK